MVLQSPINVCKDAHSGVQSDTDMSAARLFVAQTQEAVSRRCLRLPAQHNATTTLGQFLEAYHRLEDSLERADPTSLSSSLSRLFCFSVWIAECYGVVLRNAYSKSGIPGSLSTMISSPECARATGVDRLRVSFSDIVRNLDYYQSSQSATDPEDLRPLSQVIPEFHQILVEIGRQHDVDIATKLNEMLRAPGEDALPSLELSPAHAASVRSFEPVVNRSYCPFANKARLWGAQPYRPQLTLSGNIRRAAETLKAFTRVARREELDGFVIALPNILFGQSMDRLSLALRTVLTTMRAQDVQCSDILDRTSVTAKGWRFSFLGEDFFVPVFAPIYGQDHPRYTFQADDQIFVVFQPDSSFHSRMTTDKKKLRKEIKSRFREGFQPYTCEGRIEADRFLPSRYGGDVFEPWYQIETAKDAS